MQIYPLEEYGQILKVRTTFNSLGLVVHVSSAGFNCEKKATNIIADTVFEKSCISSVYMISKIQNLVETKFVGKFGSAKKNCQPSGYGGLVRTVLHVMKKYSKITSTG